MLRTRGPLKAIEPINIHFFQLLEKSNRTQIGILPALGWNNYNKTLLGILLYSPLLPKQTIEYQLMPMVGLGNHDIAGMGKVSLNLFRNSPVFESVQMSMDARRFGYAITNGSSYNRFRGEMIFTFRNKDARSLAKKSLKFGYTTAGELAISHNNGLFEDYFLTLDAAYSSRNILNPYGINFNVEVNNDYAKSSLDLNFTHSMKYARNAIQIRLFAAGFLEKESDFDTYYAFKLSGTSGINDYKYEHLYLGRYEHIEDPNRQVFLSQQFVMNEGGFASNNPFALSDKWLTTLGLTVRIPKVPLYLFVNAGTYSGAGETTWDISGDNPITSEIVAYEAGILVNLGNVVKVYFPVVVSPDIASVNDVLTDNYWQTIRYIIDFNVINPFKIKNRIY